jgi:hypothetical protein
MEAKVYNESRDSAVGIVTGYVLHDKEESEFDSR